ncbi:hypothetical protein ACFLVC_00900 [Chloroflexota bacterium]
MNDDAILLWRLHNELTKTANEFVSKQIGLLPSSLLHRVFEHHWMESAFPKGMKDSYTDINITDPKESKRGWWFDQSVVI